MLRVLNGGMCVFVYVCVLKQKSGVWFRSNRDDCKGKLNSFK